MDKIIDGLGNLIIPAILVSFFLVLAFFIVINNKVKILDKEIIKSRSKSRSGMRLSRDKKSLEEDPDATNLGRNLDFLDEFNQIRINYLVLEQIIPIFPLLGILGTVSGLIPLLADENLDLMWNNMGEAMYTTFLGLVAAIVLKAFDALVTGKNINKMAVSFDMFDQSYQMAKDKIILENDK